MNNMKNLVEKEDKNMQTKIEEILSRVDRNEETLREIKESTKNLKKDEKRFSFAKFYKELNIDFKQGYGEFDISRYRVNDEDGYKNLAWIILENEDKTVSTKIDILNTFEDFVVVSGPYVKDETTYNGCWSDTYKNEISGLDEDDNIIRGAIFNGKLKGLFGDEEYAKNIKLKQVFVTKNKYGDNVLRFRYENKGSKFKSKKVFIKGIAYKA